MSNRYIIGIDIGGTHFRMGAVQPDNTVQGFRKVPVQQVLGANDPIGDLAKLLRDFSSTPERSGQQPEAVAIGFPATLDAERRTVLQAPNLPFMQNLPVADTLASALELPVFIERDVTMALLFDSKAHSLPVQGIHAGFYFGTGIGNAICINGVPLVGRNGTAGELGHVPVDGSDLVCGCGNTGCLENLAGGKYLAQICRQEYAGTAVRDVFSAHGEDTVLLRFVDRMAMAVATEINILNPDYILIGGGVPNMAGFPKAYLLDRIRARTRKPLPAEDLNVILTEDADEKCVVGAAMYARTMLARNAPQPAAKAPR